MNMKAKLLGAAAGALFLGLSASTANADTISDILLGGADNTPLLSDNSAEYLINANGGTDTTVDIGDRLRGILQIGTIENPGTWTLGAGTGNSELSALFDVVVTGKVCGVTGCSFTFGAYDGFEAELTSFGFTNVTGGAIAFFEDTVPDFTRVDGIATGETNAIDGNEYWLFGFDGLDDFWNADTDTDDLSIVAGLPPTTVFGDFTVGLSLLSNPFGIALGNVPCFNPDALSVATVNACANGLVHQPDTENEEFDVWNDVNFTIAVVPEPGTLSIVGLGLLGLGYASRRRKSKKS